MMGETVQRDLVANHEESSPKTDSKHVALPESTTTPDAVFVIEEAVSPIEVEVEETAIVLDGGWGWINFNFLCLLAAYFFISTRQIAFQYLPVFMLSFDLERYEIAVLMSIFGIWLTIGQLCIGFIVDLLHLNSKIVFVLSQAVIGATAICIPHCHTYVLLAFVLSLIGLTAGFTGSLRLLITTEVTGREKCKEGFSMINLITGIVFSVGSPLFGLLYDVTKSLKLVFYISGSCQLLAVACIFIICKFIPNMSFNSVQHEPVLKDVESYQKRPAPLDGGWGWVVCFAAASLAFIVNGLTSSSGIFLIGLTRIFDDPVSKLSLIGALLSGLSMLAAPVASMLLVYFSHRTVIILAGLLGFIGAVLGAFSTSIDMMIATYGLIAGVSLGMSFFTGQIIAGFYFEKKRALAIGISNCGGGMGILVANMLVEYLIEFYGPRGTLLLISGALLNIVVFGSLCRPLQYAYKNVEQKESKDGTNQTSVMEDEESHNTGSTRERRIRNERFIMLKETQNVESLSTADKNGLNGECIVRNRKDERSLAKRCSNIIGVELFKNVNFVLLMLSYGFWVLSITAIIYMPPLCVWSFGMTQKKSAILMSLLGLFTTIGEFLLGVFVDLLHFGTKNMYIFSLLISSVSTMLLPYCYTFQYIAPVVCLYSLALGFTVSLRLVLTTEVVGLEHSTKAYSVLCVTSGIAGLVSPPLFGLFYDITGSFLVVFHGSGACGILALVVISLITLRNKFCIK
uniref:Major facilitator superfamily (MFS) profile domain-containing protein n=2 Tax=Octopus bimaculoides TaxID=37653 RepID=A0A0L8IES1_OCTBM